MDIVVVIVVVIVAVIGGMSLSICLLLAPLGNSFYSPLRVAVPDPSLPAPSSAPADGHVATSLMETV